MSFKSPKQRAFFFAKKSGKPKSTAPLSGGDINNVKATASPSNSATVPAFKIPGLPKSNKFGRIKKNFKKLY